MTSRHDRQQRDDDPCTALHLPFEPASARVARKQLVAELRMLGMRDTFVHDAELVLGELAANGLEHGRPNADGLIDISWCIDDGVVRISVCDGGPPSTLRKVSFSDDGARGRGLAIVEHICDAWTVEHHDGLRVTAELQYRD
ncbi:ATP-binding protein [Aeromicrobium stalagmiti]|uniref:ATP-binding protein n=1 Tax=Aeromicrobium stalagmiti TaxID=2738988 RepID=UPI001568380B|nr:ATP-binding protein [Aeromicrobium stalagmiti]NRQ48422.1 ATP-binding protein [Aeromicrobium stalagmiti]